MSTRTIICIANNKGGTGKTETVKRLSIAYAEQGYKVTAIDLDGQANLTDRLLGEVNGQKTITDVLEGHCLLDEAFYSLPSNPNICLIPANGDLDDTADDMVIKPLGIMRLKNAIERSSLEGLVLIDCPPNLGALTFSAFVTSDYVLIPAKPEPGAIKGIDRVLSKLDEVREGLGNAPAILGTIATMTRHTAQHQTGIEQMQTEGKPPCLTQIPLYGGRDMEQRLNPLYGELAKELMKRVGN